VLGDEAQLKPGPLGCLDLRGKLGDESARLSCPLTDHGQRKAERGSRLVHSLIVHQINSIDKSGARDPADGAQMAAGRLTSEG
jgi:hypothetical protein